MKTAILLASLLFLAACETTAETQANLDSENAARDNAWCASIGIDAEDQRYALCRSIARDAREDAAFADAAQRNAQTNSLLGAAQIWSLTNPVQPQPQSSFGLTTCRPLGAGVSCIQY